MPDILGRFMWIRSTETFPQVNSNHIGSCDKHLRACICRKSGQVTLGELKSLRGSTWKKNRIRKKTWSRISQCGDTLLLQQQHLFLKQKPQRFAQRVRVQQQKKFIDLRFCGQGRDVVKLSLWKQWTRNRLLVEGVKPREISLWTRRNSSTSVNTDHGWRGWCGALFARSDVRRWTQCRTGWKWPHSEWHQRNG